MLKKVVIVMIALVVAFFVLALITKHIKVKSNQGLSCSMVIADACFLKTPICVAFPTPCDIPMFWYQKRPKSVNYPSTPKTTIVDYKSCEQDSDCIMGVNPNDCTGCNCGIPINKEYKKYTNDLWLKNCSNVNVPVCDIYCLEVKLACVNNKCIKR